MPEKVHIPVVVEPDEALPPDLLALRRFAWLMDQWLTIPGTRFRFGLDAILGIVPWVGDLIGALMSVWIVGGALRHRVPALFVLRMIGNVAADLVFGSVPLAGDAFDFLFDQNVRNMRLLEQHRNRHREPRTIAQIALVLASVAALLLLLALALLASMVAAIAWLVGSLA